MGLKTFNKGQSVGLYLNQFYFTLWPSWPSWSYGSWIYNYLCNQCLSLPTLWFRIRLRRGVVETTLSDKVCQWLATGRWFSQGTLVSSLNKTDCHDITEILLKVAFYTIILTHLPYLVLAWFAWTIITWFYIIMVMFWRNAAIWCDWFW